MAMRTGAKGRQHRRRARVFSYLLAGPIAGIVIAGGLAFAPGSAQAVECANGGVGPNPAGDDTGDFLSTACGSNATASGTSSSAYGAGSTASATGSSVYGVDSTASDTESSAYGIRSEASGVSSAAFGDTATASGQNSSAYGFESAATGASSTALGRNTVASGISSVAIGDNADATMDGAIAMGQNAQATGTNSVAVGAGNTVTGANSGAFGTGNTVNGNGSFAIGDPNVVNGNNSFAFGDNNTITGDNSLAIGNTNTVNHTNAAAFGNGVTTTRANQQAFGTASNTYTMAGITSAASRTAQSGPLEVVTTDANGNLASTSFDSVAAGSNLAAQVDRNTKHIGENTEGVAMAMAMDAPTLLPGENLAFTGNWGSFEGENAMAFAGTLRVSNRVSLNGGVGFGASSGNVGGRAGLRIGW